MNNEFMYVLLFFAVMAVIFLIVRLFIKRISFFANSILGLCGLFVVNAICKVGGVYLGYNIISIVTTVLFGLPGLAFLIIEKLI